jgi:hypothetical protein
MREISGDIILPPDCPIVSGATVLIEIRDVSRADALSTVVAQTRLTEVNLRPGDSIPFSLIVPEVSEAQSLGVQIHISSGKENKIMPGDLLTTRSYPVPSRGPQGGLTILVNRI